MTKRNTAETKQMITQSSSNEINFKDGTTWTIYHYSKKEIKLVSTKDSLYSDNYDYFSPTNGCYYKKEWLENIK